MALQHGDDNRYWLGSSYYLEGWGIYYVYASGYVDGNNTYNSFGGVNSPSHGVRPVVSLQADIELEANSNLSNIYEIK